MPKLLTNLLLSLFARLDPAFAIYQISFFGQKKWQALSQATATHFISRTILSTRLHYPFLFCEALDAFYNFVRRACFTDLAVCHVADRRLAASDLGANFGLRQAFFLQSAQ